MIERACRTPWRRLCLLLPLVLVTAGAAAAQEAAVPDPYEPVRRDPIGTRLINLPTPYTVGDRRLEVLFTHRFQQTVQDGDERDLWGLDGGSDVGIGLAWGVTPHLDLALFRSSFQENFELSAKYLILEQAPRVPVTVGVRAGADIVRRREVEDANRPFVQLLLTRRLAPGVSLVLAPSWVRDTPRLREVFNLPVGITFPVGKHLIELEWIPANRDLDESVDGWHVALSREVGNHVFEIVAGNSRATTVDQYLGGDFAGGFERGDVRLGFNLVRDFDF
ncbi:MAG TPA: hypothetical protein DD490_10095 [Acidobacteria bacterium]|nr:hypothetical protein [Acidobacteriota bacterium]